MRLKTKLGLLSIILYLEGNSTDVALHLVQADFVGEEGLREVHSPEGLVYFFPCFRPKEKYVIEDSSKKFVLQKLSIKDFSIITDPYNYDQSISQLDHI